MGKQEWSKMFTDSDPFLSEQRKKQWGINELQPKITSSIALSSSSAMAGKMGQEVELESVGCTSSKMLYVDVRDKPDRIEYSNTKPPFGKLYTSNYT